MSTLGCLAFDMARHPEVIATATLQMTYDVLDITHNVFIGLMYNWCLLVWGCKFPSNTLPLASKAVRLRRTDPSPRKGKAFGSYPKSIELLDTHLIYSRARIKIRRRRIRDNLSLLGRLTSTILPVALGKGRVYIRLFLRDIERQTMPFNVKCRHGVGGLRGTVERIPLFRQIGY